MVALAASLVAIALVMSACDVPERGAPSAAEPGCASGYLDDEGSCVLEACGRGTWGELEPDGSTVFVDAGAGAGGDGSEAEPFSSIQDGLDAAGAAGGGMVAVAAGTYPEALSIGSAHANVHLAGRCSDLVTVDARELAGDAPGLDIGLLGGALEVSGISVRGGQAAGVQVTSGSVTLRGIAVEGAGYVGLLAVRSGVEPVQLEVVESTLADNVGMGIVLHGTGVDALLRDTHVRASQPGDDGRGGYGVQISDGAGLAVEGGSLLANSGIGLAIDGTGSTCALDGVTVADTRAHDSGGLGYGIQVSGGALLTAADSECVENTGIGVIVGGAGTRVEL